MTGTEGVSCHCFPDGFHRDDSGLSPEAARRVKPMFRSSSSSETMVVRVPQELLNQLWAATTTELEGVTGAYFDTHSQRQELHPTAYDATVHARIRDVLDLAESSHLPV